MRTSLPRINELLFLKILKSIQLNLKNCLLITDYFSEGAHGFFAALHNELLFLKIQRIFNGITQTDY